MNGNGWKWSEEVERLVRLLATERRRQQMTTYDLADRMEATQSGVSGMLTMRHVPTLYTYVRMLTALGLRVAVLPAGHPLWSEIDLATVELYETTEQAMGHRFQRTVAPDESNPTGQLDGVDDVGVGDVPGNPK